MITECSCSSVSLPVSVWLRVLVLPSGRIYCPPFRFPPNFFMAANSAKENVWCFVLCSCFPKGHNYTAVFPQGRVWLHHQPVRGGYQDSLIFYYCFNCLYNSLSSSNCFPVTFFISIFVSFCFSSIFSFNATLLIFIFGSFPFSSFSEQRNFSY